MLINENGSIPLYIQIKDLLVARISNGTWAPGDIIPSEMQLAEELDVSQGTARKAITELVERNVLVRKQGRGTFVANHDTRRALFHFFHLTANNGHKELPDSTVLRCHTKKPSRKEATKLSLGADSRIIRIERIRHLSNKPTIIETVTLPEKFFGELTKSGNCKLPNMLYEVYEQKFGITIHSANERLRAVAASKQDASALNIDVGSPLLEIERVALTLDKTPIELRVSRCITSNHYYDNTIF